MRLLAGRIGQIINYHSLASDVGVYAIEFSDGIKAVNFRQAYDLFNLGVSPGFREGS